MATHSTILAYFCFIDYAKAFDCVDHNKLWKILKEESEKVGLKLNIQKTKVMASHPITSWKIDAEIMETVRDYVFRLQNHCRW